MSNTEGSGVERELDVGFALFRARFWVATVARPVRFNTLRPPCAFTRFFVMECCKQAGSWPPDSRPTQASPDDFAGERAVTDGGKCATGVEQSGGDDA